MTQENTQLKIRLSKAPTENKSMASYMTGGVPTTGVTPNTAKKSSRKDSHMESTKKGALRSSVYNVAPEEFKNSKQISKSGKPNEEDKTTLSPPTKPGAKRKSVLLGKTATKQPASSSKKHSGAFQQEDEELNYTNDGVMDMLKQKSVMDENREANPNEIIEEEGEGEQ